MGLPEMLWCRFFNNTHNNLLSTDEIAKNKTKTAVWIVSNCVAPSGRNLYVKEMMVCRLQPMSLFVWESLSNIVFYFQGPHILSRTPRPRILGGTLSHHHRVSLLTLSLDHQNLGSGLNSLRCSTMQPSLPGFFPLIWCHQVCMLSLGFQVCPSL